MGPQHSPLFVTQHSSGGTKIVIGLVTGIVIGKMILLSLYRVWVVGKILLSENLDVGNLPTPPNDSPDRDDSGEKNPTF